MAGQMTRFDDGWEKARREEVKAEQAHQMALIQGYETMIKRYQALGISDRIEDARTVLRRLRSRLG